MAGMFKSAGSFDQPIGYWPVSDTVLVLEAFKGASALNQDFCWPVDIDLSETDGAVNLSWLAYCSCQS